MFVVQSSAFRMGVGSAEEARRLAGAAVAEGAGRAVVWECMEDRAVVVMAVKVERRRRRSMKAVDEYKDFIIVETDWTTETERGIVPVYIIRGLKERPSRPFLTSVEECRAFIDDELRARAETDEAMSETWECRVRSNGRASVVTVPAETMRRLGLEIGDAVRVTVARI